MVEITQSNPKALETFTNRIKELTGFESKVGWFEGAKYENGTPVAYVATIQEFGSGPIPPRPFMRPTAIEQKQKWSDIAGRMGLRVAEGKMTGKDAMEAIGQVAEADVAKTIESITTPPLSILTLMARKRRQEGGVVTGKTLGEFGKELKNGPPDLSGVSTKPLDDTHRMLDTLTHITESSTP